MANIIQIKRGSGAPSAGALKIGELGLDLSTDTLYVGKATDESPSAAAVIPITRVGSITPSDITWGSQTAKYVFAAPNGSAGTPSFRALVASDIPNLGVAQGGTGVTQFTANSLIMSGNSTTAALTTRAITNNTSNTAITTSTNIPTMNTLYYGLVTVNGASQTRATAIYAPTSAGTANQILVSNGSSAPTWKATASGAAYATSANGTLTFGTLPVAQGGTGLTSLDTFVRTTGTQTIAGIKTFDNNIILSATNVGLLLTDSGGNRYAGFVNNSSNLWIGAGSTTSIHHVGGTYISAGLSSSDTTKGNPSIYICVPTRNDTTYSGTNYQVFHKGNLTYGTGNPSGGTNGDVYIKYTA